MNAAQKKAFVERMAKARKAGRKATGKVKRSRSTGAQKVPPRQKGSRRNTGGAETRAAKVYEEFHGRPPGVVIDVETPMRGHSVLAGIGKLIALVIETAQGPRFEVTVEKFGGAYLCMDTKKTQLFIEGGNQSVDLKAFNIVPPIHENEVLGRLVWVYYDTVKDHLGKDGGDAIYKHKFSRNGPTVIYDTRNKLLFLAGGVYDMPPEGISG